MQPHEATWRKTKNKSCFLLLLLESLTPLISGVIFKGRGGFTNTRTQGQRPTSVPGSGQTSQAYFTSRPSCSGGKTTGPKVRDRHDSSAERRVFAMRRFSPRKSAERSMGGQIQRSKSDGIYKNKRVKRVGVVGDPAGPLMVISASVRRH